MLSHVNALCSGSVYFATFGFLLIEHFRNPVKLKISLKPHLSVFRSESESVKAQKLEPAQRLEHRRTTKLPSYHSRLFCYYHESRSEAVNSILTGVAEVL